jgi:hypothetical protein
MAKWSFLVISNSIGQDAQNSLLLFIQLPAVICLSTLICTNGHPEHHLLMRISVLVELGAL